MPGFVVCPACGTRIKAGREHCLRCFAELPDEGVEVRPPMWESLGLSARLQLAMGIGAVVAVAALLVIIWRTQLPTTDDVARPSAAGKGTPAPRPSAPAVPSASVRPEPSPGAPDPIRVAETQPAEIVPTERANLESSRAAFEEALEKKPDDPETLNNLGLVLVRLNLPDQAIGRFERAIALAPDKATYHVNLAQAAAELGQSRRAVDECREAARLLPDDYTTRYAFALALQKDGDHEAAISEFEQAIPLAAPGNPIAHLSYAVSLEEVQRTQEAIREYSLYLERRPTAPDAKSLRAHLDALRQLQP